MLVVGKMFAAGAILSVVRTFCGGKMTFWASNGQSGG